LGEIYRSRTWKVATIMKIIALLNNSITDGGGFNQAMNESFRKIVEIDDWINNEQIICESAWV
jgi:hypothetical protein